MSELDAKFHYIQLCQSLKTYGFTFFFVKEKKMKGHNRLVRCLLGINKESIMRVDEKTKEVSSFVTMIMVARQITYRCCKHGR